MALRQRIFAVVCALTLLGVTLSTGWGHGNDRVDTSSVSILPGPLTANLTWVSWETPSGNTSTTSSNGSLVVHVLDERGNAAGWNISISTKDFSGPNGHLGAYHLALSPDAITMIRGNPDLTSHSTFSIEPMNTRPSLLWSVSNLSGDGEYDLFLNGTPGLPGDQYKNYSYTLIVNIDGAAP